MTLRLTKTSLPTTNATSAEDAALMHDRAETALVRGLAAQAAPALARGDTRAYLDLFSQASALEHPQRGYQARKLLLEHGLAALAGVTDARAVEILLAMAHGVIEALEHQPAEPVLLNYAGVIFYELWALAGARALFQAAKRLDRDLPHLSDNLAALKRRSSAGHGPRHARHPALVALSARAKHVAKRAQPARDQRLSLCMIVRDEEEMLPRALDAVRDAVDEIIIVDTGSQDDTVALARSYGATVIEREWTGSFSDARNVSLDAATGDWFLYLDADEVLVKEDTQKLRALLGQTWREAFYLDETNFTGADEHGVTVVHSALRLLRNRPEYRFDGRLHEQIAVNLPAYLPERITQSPVRINHYGYLGVVRAAKDKSRRNIELLKAQAHDGPTNAFFHYNLGSEYFAAGEVDSALSEFEQSDAMVRADRTMTHEFVPSLTVRHVKTLRAAGRDQDALARAQEGLERFPAFTDLVFEQALASMALDQPSAATRYLEQAIGMGDAPSRYTAMVGAGTFLPRIVLATLQLNGHHPDSALELLRWCAQHHPEHLGTIHPYATALLQTGVDAEAVVTAMEREFHPITAAQRFMLGTALFERGHAPLAEAQFRGVLQKQPHGDAARAALTESLPYQRRYAEAADAAASVHSEGAVAVVALRSELFARLLADDLDGAAAGLKRARAVGLPDYEQALYHRWLASDARAGGEPKPAPLAAVPLLARMLESLLRVHDFEHFELLARLLAEVELPARERHELLAQMYLRRGFLRSAGREWMAVCADGDDTRALIGLARVALANRQGEAARTFAEQALRIEPDSTEADRLAARAREVLGEPVPAVPGTERVEALTLGEAA